MACCAARPRTRRPPAPAPTPAPLASLGPAPGQAHDGDSSDDTFYSAEEEPLGEGAGGAPETVSTAVGEGWATGFPTEREVGAARRQLSATSVETLDGWEQAATWESHAGTAMAHRKPASDDTGVFVFFFEGGLQTPHCSRPDRCPSALWRSHPCVVCAASPLPRDPVERALPCADRPRVPTAVG